MQKEIIRLSKKELNKLQVIHKVLEKRMNQQEAAAMLSLSVRHTRRLVRKILENGDISIAHANRGRPSNRKYSDEFRDRVINIVRENYHDFGPTLAAEKLEKLNRITISRETLRNWMIREEIWIPRSKRKSDKEHFWRKRKDYFGEMVQTDGSVGKWFEDRGPKAVMMAYIDDSTGIPFARFYPAEDTRAAMDSFRKYVEIYGIPKSLYFDRNSIYKTTRQANLDEELKGKSPETQFEKVLNILEVEKIFAYSPQAKGRVERLFSTLKDRLIKEMRLAGVCSIDDGNKFLETYLPEYVEQFGVKANNPENLHRRVPADMDLNWVFAFREKRVVTNDFTIRWKNRFFLLRKESIAIKKQRVTVIENLDGEIRLWFNGDVLDFREITEDALATKRKKRTGEKLLADSGPTKPWKPADNHPWRQQGKGVYRQLQKRKERTFLLCRKPDISNLR